MGRDQKTFLSVITFVAVGICSLVFFGSIGPNGELKTASVKTDGVREVASLVLPQTLMKMLGFTNNARADGDARCETGDNRADWSDIFSTMDSYSNSMLGVFNMLFKLGNAGYAREIANIFCHFQYSMGITVDRTSLPQTVTKTFNSKTIALTASTSSLMSGVDVQGTVTVNGTRYMTLHWGGSGTGTVGMLYEGAATDIGGDSELRPKYIKWDRRTATQTLQVYMANWTQGANLFDTGMLTSSSQWGDRAFYLDISYNTSTGAITIMCVALDDENATSTTTWKGKRLYATGTKGGTMTVCGTSSIAVTDSSKSATGFSTCKSALTDATSTGSGAGSDATASDVISGSPFKYSVADLYAAGSSGAFSDSTNKINFDATPASIFTP